jgi:predicted ATPase
VRVEDGVFPFTLPFARAGFRLHFPEPVTIFAGDNGTGKSTLLEAIAENAGLGRLGGSRDHVASDEPGEPSLGAALRFAWLPRVRGFFFRAETFFDFARYIDAISPPAEGERAFHEMSHGEAFLALFAGRLSATDGRIFLVDEPEAALSPERQLEFLALIERGRRSGKAQFILATHSPILLAYPHCARLLFDHRGIREVRYDDTPHARFFAEFARDPEGYVRDYLAAQNAS